MRKIALYGLSTETERVLNNFKNYEIVGLLDGFKQDGELYGKKIISLDNAISMGIERIIVVARPGSCKAIARRIGGKCIENCVEVFDIRGKNLLTEERDVWSYNKIETYLDQECEKSKLVSSELKKKLFLKRFGSVCDRAEKQVCISSAYDVGYLFCAPMIVDFVIWFSRYVKENNIDNIWFLARDGYLIKKLFEIINTENSVYFLTSRIASIRAGIRDISDLEYVDGMKFSGTISENLRERFGIEVEEKRNGNIFDYSDLIIKRAMALSEYYKNYINNIGVKKGNIVIFDFVAKGTTQYFLQRLVPHNQLVGLYFLQLEPKFMADKNLEICPFYTEQELEKSAIFDNYYILEIVLTSPDPSCIEFDECAKPLFAKETRSESDINCISQAQQGIIDYLEDFISEIKIEDVRIDKTFDEVFLRMIHNVQIKDGEFLKLIVEDPFFYRMTPITDVL